MSFEKIRPLGTGGMATVYEARDEHLGRAVAVKELAPRYRDDPNFVALFLSEARKMATVNHPNVLAVHSVDHAEGPPRLIMEYADGGTLSRQLEEGPRSPAETVGVLLPVARGLAAVHEHGVVHRDVKPDNVFLSRGEYKIGDFGVARSPDDETIPFTFHKYVAPEALTAPDTLGAWSDVYSLGLVAYDLLLGADASHRLLRRIVEQSRESDRPDAGGDDTPWLRWHQAGQELPRVDELVPGVPVDLADVIERMVRRDPQQRFRSCDAVVAALEKLRFEEAAGAGAGAETEPIRRPETPEPDRRDVKPVTPPKAGGSTRWLKIGALVSLLVTALLVGLVGLKGPKNRTVTVRTDPPGAEVFYGENSLGDTPWEKVAPLGVTIRIEKEGYEPVELEIAPGLESYDFELALVPATAEAAPEPVPADTIRVDSRPAGAEVRVGGRSLGRTPLAEATVRAGDVLRIARRGFRVESVTVGGADGPPTDVSVVLAPEAPAARLVAPLLDEADGRIRVRLVPDRGPDAMVRVGEDLAFTIETEIPGELFVASASADGSLVQLHPRGEDRLVVRTAPGTVTVGPEFGGGLVAQRPAGVEWLIVGVAESWSDLPTAAPAEAYGVRIHEGAAAGLLVEQLARLRDGGSVFSWLELEIVE